MSTKRRRQQTDAKPSKRAKSDSDDEQSRILSLETEIFESRKNYNNIATLITLLKKQSDESLVAAIALCRIFTKLLASGELETGEDKVVLRWLRERYSDYKKTLVSLLDSEGESSLLTLCMRMLKSEGTSLRNGEHYQFPTVFLRDIIEVLLKKTTDASLRKEFAEKYAEEHDDVRMYTFESISKLPGYELEAALDILSHIESVPESKDEIEDFYTTTPPKKHALFSLQTHKKHAQDAWLSILQLEMNKEQRKKLLGMMDHSIAPWFLKPELLMDFMTDSYNAGGSTSLLALSGLFRLMQERNLDYPSFYRKLYSLLDENLLSSKHRSRFFRLLDTFLASTHLPVVLVASFMKRLARLALFAPPAAIVVVIPWIYNLIKKHPTCAFMIHREPRTEEENGFDDPFDMNEEDPMETQAIESSLWEVVMLQSHQHPNVATLAEILSEQFTKHAYNIEDFLDHSYGSMLEAEISKDVKKEPVIEFVIPKKIFEETPLLGELWSFDTR